MSTDTPRPERGHYTKERAVLDALPPSYFIKCSRCGEVPIWERCV